MTTFEHGLNADQWAEKLEKISLYLEHPASLCIIGSAVGMFAQQIRTSIDLDIWNNGSSFFYSDLKQAVEKAGLLFNPKEEMEPGRPYIQIVQPDIVQIGPYDETITVLRETGLTIIRPPIENIIASKLTRASPRDLEDIMYLKNHFGISNEQIKAVINKFPPGITKEQTLENIVYLDVLPERPEPKKPDIGPETER
ncbi:nucleotidyl transferase AbiEii/AbiGii toxin family protein [Termitidicoccus mucosus]|uniref:Uncharacterized protein n=1 Tax=Termitidicoccus mucosus TaxID=1184151 RepID=A0A178IP53_9BACT|nr:hypothetical protein AW736_02255 [Opitutaceae bacterium TSB47]